MKGAGRISFLTSRLFRTVFLVLCFLLVCLLAYLSFFMNQFVLKSQLHEVDRSNLRLLQQSSQSVSQTVDTLNHQVSLLLSDQAVAQHLVNPQNDPPQQNIDILTQLKTIAQLYPDVVRIWLYAPGSDTV